MLIEVIWLHKWLNLFNYPKYPRGHYLFVCLYILITQIVEAKHNYFINFYLKKNVRCINGVLLPTKSTRRRLYKKKKPPTKKRMSRKRRVKGTLNTLDGTFDLHNYTKSFLLDTRALLKNDNITKWNKKRSQDTH